MGLSKKKGNSLARGARVFESNLDILRTTLNGLNMNENGSLARGARVFESDKNRELETEINTKKNSVTFAGNGVSNNQGLIKEAKKRGKRKDAIIDGSKLLTM